LIDDKKEENKISKKNYQKLEWVKKYFIQQKISRKVQRPFDFGEKVIKHLNKAKKVRENHKKK
jgi:hypothetical protein